MASAVRVARLVAVAGALVFAGVVAATRAGAVDPAPAGLAAAGTVVLLAATAAFGLAIPRALRSSRARGAAVAEATLFLGLAIAAGAGLATWATALRGVVVLEEGESVSLSRGANLNDLSRGPLADLSKLDLSVRLVDVRLLPHASGGFVPESAVSVKPPAAPRREVVLTPGQGVPVAGLVLHQGAFGFAPRIVVQRDGVTMLDRTVPFTTRREGPSGVAFEAEFEVAGPGLLVVAAVDLDGLDENMKGHPALAVELRRGAEVLGQGRLLPGHGATMRDGWHMGYGGMKMWSEIDLRTPNRRLPVIAGLALFLLGAVAWPVLARRAI